MLVVFCSERMQEIRRQKEKLEEKIMDLYRTPGHSPAKRKGILVETSSQPVVPLIMSNFAFFSGFGSTIMKTIQSFGKSGENRRRRDGLPISVNSPSSHGDSHSLQKADSNSDIGASLTAPNNIASDSRWSPDVKSDQGTVIVELKFSAY